MTCPVPPTWPLILALFIAVCGYYFATGVLLAKVRALSARVRTMSDCPFGAECVTCNPKNVAGLTHIRTKYGVLR